MDGGMLVSYKVLCEGDFYGSVTMEELLKNEKVIRVIKSEFATGQRNIDISFDKSSAAIEMVTKKVRKDDYADVLVLAEEDATAKKVFKKDCSGIELVDIETL